MSHILPLTAEEVERRLLKVAEIDTKIAVDLQVQNAEYLEEASLIQVNVNNHNLENGAELKFRAPENYSKITGLRVVSAAGSDDYAFFDANGNDISSLDNLFAKDSIVKVILDVDTKQAFVQNADTNAYLEEQFEDIKDRLGNLDSLNTDAKESLVEALNEVNSIAKSGGNVQSDWEQTDTAAPDYIKNKFAGKAGNGNAAIIAGGAIAADGDYSIAAGLGTRANEQCQVSIGQYNAEDSNALFIIGNGTGESAAERSNAFTVNNDGSANISTVGEDNKNVVNVEYLNSKLAEKSDIGSATTNGGEIFNDYENNIALSSNTHAEGQNTLAGIKGFNAIAVDTDNLLITVDDSSLEEKASTYYAVGDTLQFDASKHHYNKLKIVSLSTNDNGQSVIGIEKLTDEEIDLSLDSDPNENYVWIVGKNFGVVCPMAYGSHAEGEGTIAMGRAVHAEGRQTQAIGNYAHAEGRETVALYCAHAEGLRTNATGYQSHAEGSQTNAAGVCSHAEGFQSKSVGDYSHAEGHQSQAVGDYSHAEGLGTIASTQCQHVQGMYNIEDVNEDYAHIVGNGSKKVPSNAHTLDWDGNAWFAGKVTVGSGKDELVTKTELSAYAKADKLVGQKYQNYAGAEIFNYSSNVASSEYAHAEGYFTKATGVGAHAEGYSVKTNGVWSYVIAEGRGSHAEGGGTHAIGYYSHAEGYKTTAEGFYSHVEGQGNIATGKASHAEGASTRATADYAHTQGQNTEATEQSAFAAGYCTIADQKYQTALGKYNEPAEAKDALFVVGNGANEDNRSNAFTVNIDGTAKLGASPAESSSELTVATKGYVDSLHSKLASIINPDEYMGETLPEPGNPGRIFFKLTGIVVTNTATTEVNE